MSGGDWTRDQVRKRRTLTPKLTAGDANETRWPSADQGNRGPGPTIYTLDEYDPDDLSGIGRALGEAARQRRLRRT
jgi:hypothetical protein